MRRGLGGRSPQVPVLRVVEGGLGHPRPREARRATPRGRLRWAVVGLALGGCLALALHTRPFLLTEIRVVGLRQLTPAEVEVDLALPPGTYTWQVRPWVVVRRLERDPLVAAARAWLIWPHGLGVAVRERIPVALVTVPGGAWEVDADGRLLRFFPQPGGALWEPPLQGAWPGPPSGLLTITGLVLRDPVPGQRAHAPGLAESLAVVRGLGGAARLVASVRWQGHAVWVLLRGGPTVDFGDGAAARRKTEVLLGILATARREGVRLAAVDVSAPDTPAVTLAPGSPPLVAPPSRGT
jgi:hypothetical protein